MIINPIAFGGGGNTSLKPYAERSGSFVLKDPKISYVEASAFHGSYGWSSILTEVSLTNCTVFRNNVFSGCSSLSRVYAPNCVEYDYAPNPSFPANRSVYRDVFYGCNQLLDITLGFSSIPSNFYNYYFNGYNPSMFYRQECTLNLPNCTYIDLRGFTTAKFSHVYAPNCTYLGQNAFANASILEAHFPQCSYISSSAFYGARDLNDVYLPLISEIPDDCFLGCKMIGFNDGESWTGSFITSNITFIGNHAFSGCMNLSVFDFSSCSYIGEGAFEGTALSSVYAPLINGVGMGTFGNCVDLRSVDLPNASYIANNGFGSCVVLGLYDEFFSGSLSFPKVQEIFAHAFLSCNNLSSISFPMLSSIYSGAFNNCYNLISLYLMGSSVCKLANSSCFVSTPIGGYSTSAGRYGSIYVPASLLSSYKTATHWSRLSSRFVGV